MNQFIVQIYKKKNAASKKTVFVDRDGTLLKDPSEEKKLEFLPGILEGLKKLNKNKVTIIVITNQPAIAKGKTTISKVKSIHNDLINQLRKKGGYINAVYFCPHHPEKNHTDIPLFARKYRIECECRKPKLAMFKKAVEDFNINLKSSYIIGDRTADIKAGENLGIETILVKTGHKGEDKTYPISPNFISDNFNHAADIIIRNL
jgi:mannose-1-phosphate guanylyltransferase/phosphomannomutase